MAMTNLYQTLMNLCVKSSWCYAVFWKLKRRSRMMLTWEDGYYKYSRSSLSPCVLPHNDWIGKGGNPLHQGGSGDLEGQIGLAIAKMSYCVYSMGEGIIGRVAFSGKQQWVYNDGENKCKEAVRRGPLSNDSMLEKYPDEWQHQFAVGIKTIAVIAVPQGVLQLGSTERVAEDLELVDQIKSIFGTLQTLPGTTVEGQAERALSSALSRHSLHVSAAEKRQNILRQSQPVHTITEPKADESTYQGRPESVSGLLNRTNLKSISEASETAGAVPLQPKLGHMFDRRAQGASAHSSSQASQPCSMVLQFDGPSIFNQKFISSYDQRGNVFIPKIEADEMRSNSAILSTQPPCTDLMPGKGSQISGSTLNLPQCAISKATLSHDHVLNTIKDQGVPVFYDGGTHQQLKADVPISVYPSLESGADVTNMPKHHHLAQTQASVYTSVLKFGKESALCDPLADNKGMRNRGGFNEAAQAGIASTKMPQMQYSSCRVPNQDDWDNSKGVISSGCMPQAVFSDQEQNIGPLGTKDAAVYAVDDFEKFLVSNAKDENAISDYSFAIGDELSEALGPAFRRSHDKISEPLSFPGKDQNLCAIDDSTPRSIHSMPKSVTSGLFQKWGVDPTFMNDNLSTSIFGDEVSDSKPEFLLDAIVRNASSNHLSVSTGADDSFSCRSTFSGVTSGMCMPTATANTESGSVGCSAAFLQSNADAGPNDKKKKDVYPTTQLNDSQGQLNFCMSSDSSSKIVMSSWSDGHSLKSDNSRHSQLKKLEEVGKVSKKRARPGESNRPRPKDRQQIQDRVKELREIVPNSSKCSIDALLEKTIKHMLFLQSVTLHADKLKESGELKDDVENGASWALELDGHETGCPILVKDLSQPRQMLVEMICEDRGLFLEIADIIRSLDLTILKGVMESQKGKIWARFVVEANRDVHRVDVLLSLIQLLHLDKNNSSSSMTFTNQPGSIRPQQGFDIQPSSFSS